MTIAELTSNGTTIVLLESKLFTSRKVMLTGEITPTVACEFIEQINIPGFISDFIYVPEDNR